MRTAERRISAIAYYRKNRVLASRCPCGTIVLPMQKRYCSGECKLRNMREVFIKMGLDYEVWQLMKG